MSKGGYGAETVIALASQNVGAVTVTPSPRWGRQLEFAAKLVVTSVGGAGTVTILIEEADTSGGSWTTLDTFPVQSSNTTGVIRTVVLNSTRKAWIRVTGTVATNAVTYSVSLYTNPTLATYA